MTTLSYERLGSVFVALGSTLLACYAVLFSLLLPIGNGVFDYPRLVVSPHWRPIALLAFLGVVSILAGLDGVYSRMRATVGIAGAIGLLVTKVALLLQACVLTWELLLDPIVAAHSQSAFLLRDGVIATNPAMVVFRWVFLASMVVGPLLLGLAVYRSHQFPRTAIALIVVGAVSYAVGPRVSIFVAIGGIFLFAIGGLLIGVRLWQKPVPC
jgi:hypothetical protein